MLKSSPSISPYVVSVKSTMKILSIFVAFLENMNFMYYWGHKKFKNEQHYADFLLWSFQWKLFFRVENWSNLSINNFSEEYLERRPKYDIIWKLWIAKYIFFSKNVPNFCRLCSYLWICMWFHVQLPQQILNGTVMIK